MHQRRLEVLSAYPQPLRESKRLRGSMTPLDAIPFLATGSNCHVFAVLTDFGHVGSLESAPIVLDCHTNDPPLQIVAYGPRQFLQMLGHCWTTEAFESLPDDDDEDAWITAFRERWFSDPEERASAERVANTLASRFGHLQGGVLAQVRKAQERRLSEVATPTLDGLGIARSDDSGKKTAGLFHFAPRSSKDHGVDECIALQEFMASASHDERLAACRDAQFARILARDYDAGIAKVIAATLSRMGYKAEAQRAKRLAKT